MRHEGGLYCCKHEIEVVGTTYARAQLFREEICSYFDISAHTYIVAKSSLSDGTNDYECGITILEVTENKVELVAPFEWVNWRALDNNFDHSCPYHRVGHFLKSYKSNMDVEEINLAATPWRRIGFYSSVLARIPQLISVAGYEIHRKPEQVHVGSLSTIFKISANRGSLSSKQALKGTGNRKGPRALSICFLTIHPSCSELRVDFELEAMLSEDHDQSVHTLYIVKRDERTDLELSAVKSLVSSVLNAMGQDSERIRW